MKLPQDTSLGKLRLLETLIDYEGPQLFVCADATNSKFIAVHLPPSGDADQWLYARISTTRLRKLRNGQISLRDAYSSPESGSVYLISEGDVSRVHELLASEIHEFHLPDHDSFLSPAPVRAMSVVEYRDETFLAGLPAEIRSAAPLWETSRAVIEYLRSIRTSVIKSSGRTGRIVADFVLKPGEGRTDVPILSLGEFLVSVQRLVDSLGTLHSPSGRGLIPASVRQWTQLNAVASFPSSFALRIESDAASTITETEGYSALVEFLRLIDAGDNSKDLRIAMERLSPRAVLHYRALTKALVNNDSVLEIIVGFPDKDQSFTSTLSKNQILRIRQFLDLESPVVQEEISFRGRLVAVSIKGKSFMLDDGETSYSGRIAKECLPMINQKKINAWHKAVILDVTELQEATGEEKHRYVLQNIMPEAKPRAKKSAVTAP